MWNSALKVLTLLHTILVFKPYTYYIQVYILSLWFKLKWSFSCPSTNLSVLPCDWYVLGTGTDMILGLVWFTRPRSPQPTRWLAHESNTLACAFSPCRQLVMCLSPDTPAPPAETVLTSPPPPWPSLKSSS